MNARFPGVGGDAATHDASAAPRPQSSDLRASVASVSDTVSPDALRQALSMRGVTIEALTGGTSRVPIILLVEGVDDTTLGRVEQYSHGGTRNLLITFVGSRLDDGWHLLAAGAADVISAPVDTAAAAIVARLARWHEIDWMVSGPEIAQTLVGHSNMWRSVIREIAEIAAFTTANVLITGETGTGKELVARLVHQLDRRADKGVFVVLDCTTVVPTLSGSEFFGHERGSFTGALAPRDGAFALADGGTLFLDEVGELSLPMQAELLRVVQEGMYKKVGSNRWQTTN